MVDVLMELFNKVLNSGHSPSAWKNATVPILYKNGDKSDLKITALLVFSLIYTKLNDSVKLYLIRVKFLCPIL